MRSTLGWRFGVALGLALSLGACREGHPGARDASSVVSSHSVGRWRSAQVEVLFEKGFHGLHSGYATRVKHVLLLSDGAADHRFELGEFFRVTEMIGGLPDAEFEAKAETKFLLAFAPDDHAIALSSDGGTSWSYIALDVGDEPLFCPHLVFRSADPWRIAPTTRSLVLDILASRRADRPTTPGSALSHLDPPEAAERRFEQEVQGAGRFLCLHPEAADVRLAFAKAIVHPDHPLEFVTATWQPLLPCLQKAAPADAALRSVLLAALDSSAAAPARSRGPAAEPTAKIESRQLGEAAEILSDTSEEAVQQALARALGATLNRGSSDLHECHLLLTLSQSLANVTVLRRAAPGAVRTVLIELTRQPNACSSADVSAGFGARIHAVRGLAALPESDAREALEAMARQGCSRTAQAPPIPFDDWYATMDDQGRFLELPCWARATLAKGAADQN